MQDRTQQLQFDWMLDEDPSEEDESDLDRVRGGAAVVSATDWTAETLIHQIQRGNIELSPSFQRREAWTDSRKSRFIESLILGYPVPQIVLAERQDQRGRFIVIDGKQRLITLRRFAATEADLFRPLRLSSLDELPHLNGKTLADLELDPQFFQELTAFQNEAIRSVVIRNWPDDSYLYRVFLRLNTGSVRLSPQELRQALHPGPFVDFVDQHAAESRPLRNALRLDRADFRMRDTEILVRFFAFSEFLEEYAGDLKRFLDTTCERLNSAWAEREHELQELAQSCDRATDAAIQIFGDAAFRRWSRGRWEGMFNRAVFDVMVFYFSREEIALPALRNAQSVVDAFQALSEEDTEFEQALTSTTKSIQATYTRLRLWGERLAEVLGMELDLPTYDTAANRISR